MNHVDFMLCAGISASRLSFVFFCVAEMEMVAFLLNCFYAQLSIGRACSVENPRAQHRLFFRTLSPFWFFVLNAMTKW